MTTFFKLSRSQSGETVMINADSIDMMKAGGKGTTIISMRNGNQVRVDESVEDMEQIIIGDDSHCRFPNSSSSRNKAMNNERHA